MRVLLAEDDQMVGEGLQKSLSKSGYSVDWLQDGMDVVTSVQDNDYALLILDLGLPNVDGIEILKEIRRQKNDLPTLILTARDEVSDRVQGLDLGADDYMLKPFFLDELEARIRLLLRRKDGRKTNELKFENLIINITEHTVHFHDVEYVLSLKEFALLHLLMENPKSVFSRQQLEEKLYGWGQEVGSNAVEVHIHQIRKKMGKDVIKNSRGIGYKIGVGQ